MLCIFGVAEERTADGRPTPAGIQPRPAGAALHRLHRLWRQGHSTCFHSFLSHPCTSFVDCLQNLRAYCGPTPSSAASSAAIFFRFTIGDCNPRYYITGLQSVRARTFPAIQTWKKLSGASSSTSFFSCHNWWFPPQLVPHWIAVWSR